MVRDFIDMVICTYIHKKYKEKNPAVVARFLKLKYSIHCSLDVIDKRYQSEKCFLESETNVKSNS
jgi:CobQ-like glutamine amidotransferase family enzyme